MKMRRLLLVAIVGMVTLCAFGGCEVPTDYTVYGIIYTDQTMSVPLVNAKINFEVSPYSTKGYVTSDSEGKFAFFFWDDGNGNGQEVSSRTKDEEVPTNPVKLEYNGKVLFMGKVRRDEYTKEAPLLVYPGCYVEKGGAR